MVATGETVWYTGDTSMMAPQVEEAVQEYVDESHSKAVAIVPLKEPHDPTDPTAQAQGAGRADRSSRSKTAARAKG